MMTWHSETVMDNQSNQHYDLIGDIHGEREALERLLAILGYRNSDGNLSQPGGRKLLFLGDFIDRGPDSRGVLYLVRRLVEEGIALAIMGNHEINFVSYHTRDEKGRFLRSHSDNHATQVAETLRSFEGHEDEIPGWVEWMKDLPFFLDLGDLRAVHASWVPGDIAYLADKSLHDRAFLIEAHRRKSPAWESIGRVLKGVELEMPGGMKISDSNGIPRSAMRIRWWGDLADLSWRELAFPFVANLPEGRARLNGLEEILAYGQDEPPVFFGHYKLKNHEPAPQAANIATLDFGLGHGGPATAYRWSGERILNRANFIQTSLSSE
ncbi:MAG: metallophosphoesterase [Verrucomicrobiae bacterium]|nr:metallophosphoesterase [Verrucomicrobiae bacterium]